MSIDIIMNWNPEFNWLFGNLFERRFAFEKATPKPLWSQQLRKFAANPNLAARWTGLIREYREMLINPDVATKKIEDDLKFNYPDFDGSLFDILAEVCAVVRLKHFGFASFEALLKRENERTPDFRALRNGQPAAVEVKNLRAHECVEELMPKLFVDRQLKSADFSKIRLVVRRSFRETLRTPEKARLIEIVDSLPRNSLNQSVSEALSDRAFANFEVIEGTGDVVCLDYISESDFMKDTSSSYGGLFRKISADIRGAAGQVNSPVIGELAHRVVAMRWDIPSTGHLIPEDLGKSIGAIIARDLSSLGMSADVIIFTDADFDIVNTLV